MARANGRAAGQRVETSVVQNDQKTRKNRADRGMDVVESVCRGARG